MLLKCINSADGRTIMLPTKGKGKVTTKLTTTGMRMTMSTNSTMTPRIHRKVIRIPSKRHPGKVIPGKMNAMNRLISGKIPPGKRIGNVRQMLQACDNSNDSGIGIDHHMESTNHHSGLYRTDHINRLMNNSMTRNTQRAPAKRPSNVVAAIQQQSTSVSHDGLIKLHIIAQPEQQHRARYQTEGSRGAVKDRSGNGFPIVKLSGYNKPAVLQVFIGTDVGRVAPHMFYQACKVAGKNSTPCIEKKLDGTIVIEIDVKPENDMTVTCDCVGILKERNVDVEHRFPDHSGPRSKKKSTRCRMVFRTVVTNTDGTTETLQVCSQQIICTQPPGVPEISKKSLISSPVTGGLELFIIGKNFLKDTRLIFQASRPRSINRADSDVNDVYWEEIVVPDKEYLQQTHLVCTVPAFMDPDITEPVTVQLYAMSSGKRGDPQNFVYLPKGQMGIVEASTSRGSGKQNSQTASLITSNLQQDVGYTDESSQSSSLMWTSIEPKCEIETGMMPPPSILPLTVRRSSSASAALAEQLSPLNSLKTEIIDDNSQGSMPESMALQQESLDHFPGSNENSMDTTQSIREMQYIQQGLSQRKQSMDIMDERSLMMNKQSMDLNELLNENGSFNQIHDRRRLSLQLQLDTSSANIQKVLDVAVSSNHEQISPLQHLMANKTQPMMSLTSQPRDNNTVVTLFGNGTDQNTNIIFSQISNISGNQQQSTVEQMERTFNQPTTIESILNLPQSNESSVASLISNANTNSNHSSISQDIILNSQSVNNLSGGNAQILTNSVAAGDHSMSSEVILNPTVSPTMMCSNQNETETLLNTGAALSNSVLSGINLVPPPTTTETLLNNIMSQQAQQQSQAQEQDQMLKDASEYLANDQSMISSSASLMTEEHLIATTSSQQMIHNPTTLPCHMEVHSGSIFGDQSSMSNSLPTQLIGTTASDKMNLINNLVASQLMSHMDTALSQNLMAANAITTQESILNSVTMMNNEIRKEEMNIDTTAMNDVTINQASTAGGIQEITNMSDMDLLSYINPSTFDQL